MLIYNDSNYQPILEAEGFVVIRPESLIGVIEVKSNLTFYKNYKANNSHKLDDKYPLGGGGSPAYRWSGTMVEALKNIQACSEAYKPRKTGYFSGVLAYQSEFNIHNLYHALDNNELQEQLGINHLRQLPTAICTIGKSFIMLSMHDMFESGEQYPIEHESFFNAVEVVEGDEQWPLQFFSTLVHNQVGYTHSKKPADSSGLFSVSGSNIKIWSHHFDLNSDDI